jgi:hypothetical protein
MSMKSTEGCLLITLLLVSATSFVVAANIVVGVSEGDWIEYQATFTGSPPEGHEVTWARSEVTEVQGTVIKLNVTTKFSDGTQLKENVTLNLETGQIGDAFIIPANLNEGDSFEDRYHGAMTISAVEERTYAGARRTVVTASTSGSTYYWDQTTGVLVEGISQLPDYSIRSLANNTNMWQPDARLQGSTVWYALLGTAIAVSIALVAAISLRRRQKK